MTNLSEQEFAAKIPKCSRCHLPMPDGDWWLIYESMHFKFEGCRCSSRSSSSFPYVGIYPESEEDLSAFAFCCLFYDYVGTKFDQEHFTAGYGDGIG